MNQPLRRPHSLCMGEWDLGFICPKWRRILSGQYVAKLLSCRSSYIWLQYIVVKLSVLSFAPIVKPLRTRWVYERALSLALGDTNLLVDNWLQTSSYPYGVSPIAIVSQYEHITWMMYLILPGVRTQLSMVEAKDDEAVMYVNSNVGFGSLKIVKGVDRLIYIQ